MPVAKNGPTLARYRVPDHVVSEVLEDGAVVLNLQTGKYFALNRTASRMWDLVREMQEQETICQTVAREFAADLENVRTDFAKLIGDLVSRQLLEEA